MFTAKKFFLHAILPIIILVGSLGVAIKLVQSRPEPQLAPPRTEGVLVQSAPTTQNMHRLDVNARGNVTASRRVTLQPQVAGRVEWIHPDLKIGGVVKEGEPLVRIESRDYEIALEDSTIALEQARAQLAIEAGQQEIARREWALYASGEQQNGADSDLALRKPQLKMAESVVKSAQARQKRAQLELSRTTVRAPFSGFVQSTAVEVGQLVTIQSAMATLVGTDSVWVNASLPIEHVSAIDIPGARATVRQDIGGRVLTRSGEVVRLLGDLDPVGRLARVLIEVPDPFDLNPEDDASAKTPLLVGSYVEVHIEGNQTRELIEIPRRAVQNGNTVHVFEDDQTLGIREVNIVWRTPESVLIDQGLETNTRYITSSIAAPIEGMKLRIAEARND